MRKNKTYSELSSIESFEDRFEYSKIGGKVGENTFGCDRYLNQILYHDSEWKSSRRKAIQRDCGPNDVWDLGVKGFPIGGTIYVHHINPITKQDILERSPKLFDLENLICCSKKTHDAIHYGDVSLLPQKPILRTKNDTCPWKNKGE